MMAENIFKGTGVSDGIRTGKARIFRHVRNAGVDRDIAEADVEAETERFHNAVKQAVSEVEHLIERSSETFGQDKIGVLKGQKSMLADPAYCPEIEKLIAKKLCSPEKAVSQVTEKFATIFEKMKNAYMRERAADVRDAGYRLLNILSGEKGGGLSSISEPVILIADDLTPSDTIQLDKNFVLAFATQKGGKTSHTSIFAKSMGIPAAVGVAGIMDSVADGDAVILDGAQGICIVCPDGQTQEDYEKRMKLELEEQRIYTEFAHRDAVTRDGCRIAVAANIGSSAESEHALQAGAEAVGLLRTEQLYLSKETIPDENEQFIEYKKIAQAFSPREVIIRTLDIGGDKALAHLKIPKEDNPFLGYRAIRLCLDQRDLFLAQLRAILRASAFGKLKIMFPMISGCDELIAAKAALEEAKAQLRAANTAFDEKIQAGIMIEVPSAALMADALAKEADFFSIGTNDLVQYTLAVDRGNEKVSYLYDYFHPAVIRLIRMVSDAAHANGIPVGMCGGMAGDPVAVPLLVGLQLDELSMAAGAIAKAKYVAGSVSRQECIRLAAEAAECKTPKEILSRLTGFYQSHISQ